MNERIKELELEAIAYADSKVPVNDRYNDIYHSIVRGKFADLIVEECAQRAEAYAYMSQNFVALAEELRRMKQYLETA